jgi:octaprenyl-diphosphate synthase
MTIDFKQDILAPVAQDFATMDTFINEGITSKVALVMAVSKHVVENILLKVDGHFYHFI